MTSLKQLFGGGARQFGMVFALIALVLIFQFATGGKVLTPTNAQNIINGNSYVLILAIGMVLVIIAGWPSGTGASRGGWASCSAWPSAR